jgi:flagellar motor protein MotB
MDELHDSDAQASPVWAIFSDLMAALVGILVLLLVWVIGIQLELSQSLEQEKEALADPLASGRVTFNNGRIGISGSVLFQLNSDRLQPEGKALLSDLVKPLQVFLSQHDDMLMVSGFTDALPINRGNGRYADNWGLSAQRALTVTRTLIEQGMPADQVFAAAFGDNQPVAPNDDADSRARNRRVELTTVPRQSEKSDAP